MADATSPSKPITIMGAGLSGLAAATLLARAGREVHVHDIRHDSGARFDGDFQALENWSMDDDFFDQLERWGFDSSAFKSTSFSVVDLIHPDDVVTKPKPTVLPIASWNEAPRTTPSTRPSSAWPSRPEQAFTTSRGTKTRPISSPAVQKTPPPSLWVKFSTPLTPTIAFSSTTNSHPALTLTSSSSTAWA